MVGTVGEKVIVVLVCIVTCVEEVLQIVEAHGMNHELAVLRSNVGNTKQEHCDKDKEWSFHLFIIVYLFFHIAKLTLFGKVNAIS